MTAVEMKKFSSVDVRLREGPKAAGVVTRDKSLEKVDEFMHISRRIRSLALQSAVGGLRGHGPHP